MNADVEKAAQRFDSHFAERASSLSITAAITLHSWQTIRQALRDQEAEIARLRGLLRDEASLLRAWARESRDGGWSTHQVDPMNRRADDITAHLGGEQ
jgi:hypothetical protein